MGEPLIHIRSEKPGQPNCWGKRERRRRGEKEGKKRGKGRKGKVHLSKLIFGSAHVAQPTNPGCILLVSLLFYCNCLDDKIKMFIVFVILPDNGRKSRIVCGTLSGPNILCGVWLGWATARAGGGCVSLRLWSYNKTLHDCTEHDSAVVLFVRWRKWPDVCCRV